MLISVNQFRSWLRESAKTLRKGGACATADIYEEIGEQLDAGAQRLADSDREELREARQVAVTTIPPRSVPSRRIRSLQALHLLMLPNATWAPSPRLRRRRPSRGSDLRDQAV